MKKLFFSGIFLTGILFISIISCSEMKNPFAVPTHPENWLNKESVQFHGKAVNDNGPDNCRSCHGEKYDGGSSEKSCFSCHELYPHKADWKEKTSHGTSIINELYNIEDCENCHGQDYGGGTSEVSCFTCHSQFPHPADWITPDQAGFHGTAISNNSALLTECQDCHGSDYGGGTVNISCFTCHADFPHPKGFGDFSSPNFHQNYFRENNNWDIATCQQCHGSDYSGDGNSAKNCNLCHFQPDGPETCNLCHGSSTNFAPPDDLHGNNSTTEITVGAHQNHLTDITWTTAYAQDCGLCHIKPTAFEDTGHIDTSPNAEVTFGDVASGSGSSSPDWDRSSAACTNVYCHGSFIFKIEDSSNPWGYAFGETEIIGNNPAMVWTQVGSGQAACGTCHNIPPQGHIGSTPELDCSLCHGNVVDSDKNIIDKSLHINGQIDLQLPANSAKIDQLLKRLNIEK